jgi:hypothetical protein
VSGARAAASEAAEGALERLRSLLAAERGLVAAALEETPATAAGGEAFGPLAAAGERTAAASSEYELVVESILEGYLLHYAYGRIVAPADPDLGLLVGDHLYAFGLARLARLGDLDAVEELADLISLCAHLHASEQGEQPWPATSSLWSLAALAVAGGSWPEQREAKGLAREREPDAAQPMLGTARERAAQLGLSLSLDRALIAFQEAVTRSSSTT